MDSNSDGKCIQQWMIDMARSFGWKLEDWPFTLQQVKSLLNARKLCDPILHLYHHAKPLHETEKIRKAIQNSFIKKSLFDGDNKNNNDGKRKYQLSVIEEERKVLEADMNELLALGIEEEKLVQKERELQRKLTLQNQLIEKKSLEKFQFEEWHKDINVLVHTTPSYPSSKSEERLTALANAERDLKNLLCHLTSIRHFILEDNDKVHKEKVKVWVTVDALLKKHAPSILHEAMMSITLNATSDVRKTTEEIDLVKDAISLGLKYDKKDGILKENSQTDITKTIDVLLLQMNAKHIQKRVDKHRVFTNTASAKAATENISKKMYSAIKDAFDESFIEDIEKLAKERIYVAGCKAALSKSVKLSSEMSNNVELAKIAQQKLIHQHKKIQSFEEDVKKNTHIVKCLALSVSSAYSKLKAEEKELLNLPASYRDSFQHAEIHPFSEELKAVQEIPFEMFHTVLSDAGKLVPYTPLTPLESLYLNSKTNHKIELLAPISSHWVYILDLWRQDRRWKTHLKDQIDLEKMKYKNLVGKCKKFSFCSLSYAQNLNQKVKECDEKNVKDYLSLLDNCEEALKDGKKELESFERTLRMRDTKPAFKLKL